MMMMMMDRDEDKAPAKLADDAMRKTHTRLISLNMTGGVSPCF